MSQETSSMEEKIYSVENHREVKDSISTNSKQHKGILQLLLSYEDALEGFWDFIRTHEYLLSNISRKNLFFSFQLYEIQSLYDEIEKDRPKITVTDDFLLDYLKVVQGMFTENIIND